MRSKREFKKVLFISGIFFSSLGYAAPPTPTPSQTAGTTLFSGNFGDLPTHISSNTLTLKSEERFFIYVGNVIVIQGDMTLTSKTLEGTYNENNQIEHLKAKGDVVITKVDMKATSQTALYDAATSVVTLIDNPQMTQNESILTADKIKMFLNENRSQAEGQVRVTLVKKEDVKGTPTPRALASASPVAATVATPVSGLVPAKATEVPKAKG